MQHNVGLCNSQISSVSLKGFLVSYLIKLCCVCIHNVRAYALTFCFINSDQSAS